MASTLLTLVTEPERMPFPLQMAFMATGLVLLLVVSVRSWQSHREWKAKSARGQRTRYRPSPAMRLEGSLVMVGWMICWAVADSRWTLRALFGGTALLGILITLYRGRSETKETPTFDDASVLHVEPQVNATSHAKS